MNNPILERYGITLDKEEPSIGKDTKFFEGWRSNIYQDPGGRNRAIGYGFNIDEPSVSALLPEDVRTGKRGITKEEATPIFEKKYNIAQKEAKSYLGEDVFNTSPKEVQNIISDMTYNMGLPTMSTFKNLKQSIINKDWDKAANDLKDSNWYRQTGRRGKKHEGTLRKLTPKPKEQSFLSDFLMPSAEAAEQEGGFRGAGVSGEWEETRASQVEKKIEKEKSAFREKMEGHRELLEERGVNVEELLIWQGKQADERYRNDLSKARYEDKRLAPIKISKEKPVLNLCADIAEKIIPYEKWQEFQKKTLAPFKPENIISLASSLGKMATMGGFRQMGALVETMKKTPPEERKAGLTGKEENALLNVVGEAAKTIHRPFATLQAMGRKGIENIQEGKAPLGMDTIEAGVRGFFVPEEVKSIVEKIPGITDEDIVSSKGIGIILVRAVSEAIETVALSRIIFGKFSKPKGHSENIVKAQSQILGRGGKNIIQALRNAGRSDAEIARLVNNPNFERFILHGVKHPETGKTIAQSLGDIQLMYTAQLPFKPGDVVKLGKQIGTIIKTEGGKALLNIAGKEISASLSQLTPKDATTGQIMAKKPITEPATKPLIEEARKFKTPEEFVEKQIIDKIKSWSRIADIKMSEQGQIISAKNELSRGFVVDKNTEEILKKAGVTQEEIKSGKITVYRATDRNEITEGAFVTPDKTKIEPYLGQLKEIGKDAKIISKKVFIEDLLIGDEYSDFVYAPNLYKTKSQLTDIWKQAQEKPPSKEIVAEKIIRGERLLPTEKEAYPDLTKTNKRFQELKAKERLLKEGVRDVMTPFEIKELTKITEDLGGLVREKIKRPPTAERVLGIEKAPTVPLTTAQIIGVEEKAARAAFKEGWKESKKKLYLQAQSKKTSTDEMKKFLSDYIKTNLPTEDRGKLLTRMRDVHTKKGVVKAIELVDKIWEKGVRKDAISNLKKTIKGLDIAKLSPQEAEPVKTLLKDLDLVEHRKQTFLKLNKTKEYLEKNPDAEMPEYVLERLSILDKKDINTFSTGDLEDIQNSIAHYVHLNKVKNQIKVGREQRRASEVLKSSIGEMKSPVKAKNDIVQSQKSKIGKLKKTGQLIVDTFGIRHDHYDLIIESLSGPNSTMDKVLYQGPKEGIIKELKYKQDVYKTFHEDIDIETFQRKFNIKDIGAWQNEKVLIKGLNFTRGERMALYRHSLNADNRRAILEGGYGLKQSDNPYKIHKMSEETLNAILSSLTPAEKMFAGQPVANLFDNQGKELGKVFYEKNNYPLPLIDNYYPKEVMKVSLGEKQETESVLEELKHKWVRIGLSKGMLKSRVKSKLPIYLNSLAYDINKSVTHAAAYVGLEIPLSNASKLLYDKTFKANLITRYGLQTWREIDKGLRDIAGDYLSYSTVEEILLKGKNKFSTAYLGINPFVMAKQILSYPLYNIYVKPKYLMQGYADYVMDLKGTLNRHKMYSPEFAERVEGGYSRDVADVFKSGAEKRLYKGKTTIPEKVMGGIQLLDLAAVIPGTQGAVLQVLDEIQIGTFSPEVKTALDITAIEAQKLNPEDKLKLAYKFADYVTERTQPMFSPEHRSSLSRGTPVEKIATQFSSFTNQALNLIRRTYREARRTNDPKMYAKVAKVLFYLLVVNAGGVFVIDDIRDRLYKRKRRTYGEAVLDSVSSYFYFLRDLEKSVVSKVKRGDWGGFDINIPILSFANVIGGTIASGIRMIAGDKSKREKETRKFIDKSLEVILTTGGLPYRTPKRMLEIPFKKEKEPDIRKNPILEKYNIQGTTRKNPILEKYGL